MGGELSLIALVPVAVLFLLVLLGRMRTSWSAGIALVLAVTLAMLIFEAPIATVMVGVTKGLWLGTWILSVVVPALLLYRLAKEAGMDHIGGVFVRYLPNPTERLLLLAWILPSFIQGVAGFGTPIAVCAPLLLLLGYEKVRAVVLPLVGYHWSVTFGSMGASFYMASLTAGFGISSQHTLALQAAGLLGVNVVAAGALVLLIDGGIRRLRDGLSLLLTAGPIMAATLIVTSLAVPAVASLAAGAAGLLTLTVKQLIGPHGPRAVMGSWEMRDRAVAQGPPVRSLVALAPYGFLLLLILPVFLVPASRRFVSDLVQFAPSFDSTSTGRRWVNEPVDAYLPLPLFGHPGFYIGLACLLGWLTYRAAGLLTRGHGRQVMTSWLAAIVSSAPTVFLLGCLAMVLVDAGMISALATGAAGLAGDAYPAFSPVVGALGSFMTGSSTASNAMFSALQSEIATLIQVEPEILVAAQTAGANVGNSIAPIVVLMGAAAVGAVDRVGEITRRCLLPVAVLLLAVLIGVVIRIAA